MRSKAGFDNSINRSAPEAGPMPGGSPWYDDRNELPLFSVWDALRSRIQLPDRDRRRRRRGRPATLLLPGMCWGEPRIPREGHLRRLRQGLHREVGGSGHQPRRTAQPRLQHGVSRADPGTTHGHQPTLARCPESLRMPPRTSIANGAVCLRTSAGGKGGTQSPGRTRRKSGTPAR